LSWAGRHGVDDALTDFDTFRRIVSDGQRNGMSIMKGFADDPNVSLSVNDIYAYLQARAGGVVGRGRPGWLGQ
jgi:hypothetical protein